NLRWRFGWLEHVVATPAFHRWHHTADEHRDHNYASTLPVLDRLFGTWYLPRNEQPPRFGVDGVEAESFLGQLATPFLGIGSEPYIASPATRERSARSAG